MNSTEAALPEESITSRLTTGAAWITLSRVAVNLIGLASTLVLARLLLPSDFGLVAIATTITSVIASITELSLASALVHHPDPTDEHYNSAFTLNMMRATLVGAVILAIAYPVGRIYHDERLVAIMFAVSASTLLTGFVNPKIVLFTRNLVFWQEGVLNVSQRAAGFMAAVFVAVIYHSFWALVVSLMATQIVAVALSYILIPHRPKIRLSGSRELLSFSVWLSLGQAINTLNWKFDHLVIGYFLGKAPLGFYTLGDSLAVLPTREAITPIAQTLFPGFSKVKGIPQRLRTVYQKGQSLVCAVALPVGFGFIFVCQPLILLTIGSKWMPSIYIIQWLSGVFAFQSLSSSVQPLAMALGETRDLFVRDVINLVIRIPLIVAGLLFGGLQGIVIARCISGIASTFVNMAMAQRLLKLSFIEQLAANRRAILSTGLMTVVGILISHSITVDGSKLLLIYQIATLAIAGAATYCISSAAQWVSSGKPDGPETEVLRILRKLFKIQT